LRETKLRVVGNFRPGYDGRETNFGNSRETYRLFYRSSPAYARCAVSPEVSAEPPRLFYTALPRSRPRACAFGYRLGISRTLLRSSFSPLPPPPFAVRPGRAMRRLLRGVSPSLDHNRRLHAPAAVSNRRHLGRRARDTGHETWKHGPAASFLSFSPFFVKILRYPESCDRAS